MKFFGAILKLSAVFIILFPYSGTAQTDDINPDWEEELTLQNLLPELYSIDSTSIFYIAAITITGNRETKDKIILRESTLNIGDTVTIKSLEEHFQQTKNNLLKLSLFNYVTITHNFGVGKAIYININVEERWYIWPLINITPHNGNLNDWLGNPDFSKIDYCFGVKKYNFRGRKESISINLGRGYNNFNEVEYNDVAIDRKRKNTLSFYFSSQQQNQTVLTIKDNKAEYLKLDDNQAIKQYKYRLNYNFRQTLNLTHTLSYNYQTTTIHDSIAMLNPDYLGDGKTNIKFSTIKYSIRLDKRNSSYYPLYGYLYEATIAKTGITKNELKTTYTELDIRQYLNPLPRIYFSTQLCAIINSKNTPFAIRQAIGTKPNVVAGYEQYQIPGNKIFYLRTALKYEIIPTHIIHIKKLPFEKFNKIHFAAYINFFANAGYVDNPQTDISTQYNKLNNTFLGALGIGVDLVTYYDKVFCVYVSRNIQNDFSYGIGFKSFF